MKAIGFGGLSVSSAFMPMARLTNSDGWICTNACRKNQENLHHALLLSYIGIGNTL